MKETLEALAADFTRDIDTLKKNIEHYQNVLKIVTERYEAIIVLIAAGKEQQDSSCTSCTE